MTQRGSTKRRWTNERIIAAVRQEAERLGYPPTQRALGKNPALPTTRTIRRRFGTYNNALLAAGLPIRPRGKTRVDTTAPGRFRPTYTRDDAIRRLKRYANETGRVPLEADHTTSDYLPSRGVYRRLFGSFNAAVQLAGLEPRKQFGRRVEHVAVEKPPPPSPPPPDRFEGWTYDKEKGKPAPIRTERRINRNAVRRVPQE